MLIMLCFSVIILPGSAQADPGDDVVMLPNQVINARPSSFSVETKFLQIQFGDDGDGVYFHMEFNNTMPVHIVNKSIYEYYMSTGGEINSSVVVDGLTFYADNILDCEYVVPYDDIFYFFVTNSHNSPVTWEGWYAKDISAPIGNIWGLDPWQSFVKGENITIGCYYEADKFNITQLIFGLDIYQSKKEVLNTDGPVNWTVDLDTDRFSKFGSTYINFTVVDSLGNSNSVTMNIFIIDPNPTTTPPPPPNMFMFYIILGGAGVLIIVGGSIQYRNMKIDQLEDAERKKREDERPYHKTHRDSKARKKKKRWDD